MESLYNLTNLEEHRSAKYQPNRPIHVWTLTATLTLTSRLWTGINILADLWGYTYAKYKQNRPFRLSLTRFDLDLGVKGMQS